MEKSISLEYLRDLAKAYEVFIQDISKVIPVIKGILYSLRLVVFFYWLICSFFLCSLY